MRYAPGSHFAEHTHSGGEEFIVLEGVFQDEHGDYPAGTYVRNPVGTHHVPRSDDGCVIFVKLWQFDPDDQLQIAMDMNALHLGEMDGLPGIARVGIFERDDELVLLEQWQPRAQRVIGDEGGAELLILDGSIAWKDESYGKHDWLRIPAGEFSQAIAGPNGARIWIKTRHLRSVTAPSA